ncbi:MULTISPECIES: glycosyltransferase [Cyanophyceae]|uniref:glycosyltransferase n=1 Tax=Cyanophyceae TaxID=3028117 RepID=UPI0016866EA5|nr:MULTISPECIES: glycosyltransferase [Cyanophyceae]MBD1918184.1 glycosyltransferase [Phormidium sp. FACHB-77]MBD2030216.1 glycosyltransferase [Phormidium sp. FACHB-322]MBD2051412.1 glycosyltransferase [Leptolyngbya sp. FACHB-60]
MQESNANFCDTQTPIKNGKISVIIPCFKQAHYLGDAISSVLTQSYKNFEIIVVDDGSPDNTQEVASLYSTNYIYQENQGLSGARNTGLQESKGEYLVFLDADDRLTPNALEDGLNCFRSHPHCAFVSGHHRYINIDGSLLNEHPPEPIDGDYYMALLRRNYIGMHATVMYQRSVFDVVGGFDTSLKSCEDYDLYLRIVSRFPVYRHHNVTAEYRWHDSNMTHNSSRMLNAGLTVLRSQWPQIQKTPHYVRAYCAGLRFWRTYFGQQLIDRTVNSFMSGEITQTIKSLEQILKFLPLWLLSVWLELQGLFYAIILKLKLQKTPIHLEEMHPNESAVDKLKLVNKTVTKPLLNPKSK